MQRAEQAHKALLHKFLDTHGYSNTAIPLPTKNIVGYIGFSPQTYQKVSKNWEGQDLVAQQLPSAIVVRYHSQLKEKCERVGVPLNLLTTFDPDMAFDSDTDDDIQIQTDVRGSQLWTKCDGGRTSWVAVSNSETVKYAIDEGVQTYHAICFNWSEEDDSRSTLNLAAIMSINCLWRLHSTDIATNVKVLVGLAESVCSCLHVNAQPLKGNPWE